MLSLLYGPTLTSALEGVPKEETSPRIELRGAQNVKLPEKELAEDHIKMPTVLLV